MYGKPTPLGHRSAALCPRSPSTHYAHTHTRDHLLATWDGEGVCTQHLQRGLLAMHHVRVAKSKQRRKQENSTTCLVGVVQEVDVAQRRGEVQRGGHPPVLIHVPNSPGTVTFSRGRKLSRRRHFAGCIPSLQHRRRHTTHFPLFLSCAKGRRSCQCFCARARIRSVIPIASVKLAIFFGGAREESKAR